MKKLLSLLKVSLSYNMNLFKIKNKSQNKILKKMFPVFIFIILFVNIMGYAYMLIEPLINIHMEFVLLTLFAMVTVFFTLTEGIYKSGSLLFNCKDDDMLLSLPIKKSTVLFVRVFKFYVFEVLYNAMILIPAMLIYARYVSVGPMYWFVSIVGLLIIPIVPIIISCIIGGISSAISSKFKLKNLVQIIITTIFLLVIFYFSFNMQNVMANIAENAGSINEVITKVYYPIGIYIKLVTDFSAIDLVLYIISHVALFTIMLLVLGKVYYKIISNTRVVKTKENKSNNKKVEIKKKSITNALIYKEIKRFMGSPVFVINAGFGLVLYMVACVLISIKFDSIVPGLVSTLSMDMNQIHGYIPVIIFGLICITSFMTSITSSMISLEGKSFSILKSLPVKPSKIINAKVLTAALIMIPIILIGDTILFIRFKIELLQMIILIITSFILPLISESIGIIVNLKYPKMDAENDTEIVKQSMSSMISVFAGFILAGLTLFGLYKCIEFGLANNIVLIVGLILYTIIYLLLYTYIERKGNKLFDSISV